MSTRAGLPNQVSAQANLGVAKVKARSAGRSQYVDGLTIAQAYLDRRPV